MRTVTPIISALAAFALMITPAAASAAGMRASVCAQQLELNKTPNQGRDGVLAKGESFRVRKLNRSGKYAYGLAYGNINRLGWVSAAGLCNPQLVQELIVVGRDVMIGRQRLAFYSRPNQSSQIDSLRSHESFKTRKLSASGKYAYGFASGHLNKLGWVRTDKL